MKIVVFTYDRYQDITTSKFLEAEGIDHSVVCHTPAAFQAFKRAGQVNVRRLLVSGAPKGLANNRNWWLDHHLADNEWALMLVDDWKYATELSDYDTARSPLPVDTSNTTIWNRRFRWRIPFARFVQRALELTALCDQAGIRLGGFAGNDNAMFRRKHFAFDVLADGRALVVKKSALRFDVGAQIVDDFAFTAKNIRYARGTLVNQWVLPYCRRYTRGAYGNRAARMAQQRAECFYLTQKYPGILGFARKPGWPYGAHLRVQRTTLLPRKGIV